jgi:gamma-glutamyltranspeptidase/glutathione hydrolase
MTVADKRNMVSLIQSNYRGMGSGMVPLNLYVTRRELFDLEEESPTLCARRPFHTIIPAFVTKDQNPLSFGVMGETFNHKDTYKS